MQQDLNYPSEAPSIEMGVVINRVRDNSILAGRSLFCHCGWVSLGYLQKLILTDPSQPGEDTSPASDEVGCSTLEALLSGADPSTVPVLPVWRWLKDHVDRAILKLEGE